MVRFSDVNVQEEMNTVSSFFSNLSTFMYVCVCMYMCAWTQRFASPTVCVPGIELTMLTLAAITFSAEPAHQPV